MTSISFNSSAKLDNPTLTKVAQENKTTDAVVNLDVKDKKALQDDINGAVKAGKTDIFISHTVSGKTVVEKIDLTDPKNRAEIEKLNNNIDKSDFKLASISFTSNVSTTTKMFVTDYQKTAGADAAGGKDPQYKALSEYPQNFIAYDPKTGNITGAQLVKDGETKTDTEGNLITSKADSPVTQTNMKDVIKDDFRRYADPPLDQMFKYPDGVKDFMAALKNIPGNANNPNITEANAKELLSYINSGQNAEGKTNVKQLQGLLANLTGDTGKTISDKNNPPGGDDKYGYATTLQVRSLAAMIPKDILSGNPVILVDTSDSMSKELKELTTTMGQIVNPDSQYHIGRFGDTGRLENQFDKNNKPIYGNDMVWKTDGDKNTKDKVNTAVDGKTALAGLNKITNEDMGTGSKESGIRAGLLALDNLEKSPTQQNMLMFTDEGDRGLVDLNNLIGKAKEKNYRPVIIFHNDSTNQYCAIDLSTIYPKIQQYNESHPDTPIGINSFKNSEYDIDWKSVISKLNIPQAPAIKDLKI